MSRFKVDMTPEEREAFKRGELLIPIDGSPPIRITPEAAKDLQRNTVTIRGKLVE